MAIARFIAAFFGATGLSKDCIGDRDRKGRFHYGQLFT